MDESTAEQWAVIGAETMANQPRVADEILGMLRRLEGITDGFSTNQLVHALQTATLAEQADADDEVVVASLCHDIGKLISVFGHPAIAAAILRPYVRDEVFHMIEAHQDFQGQHYYHHFGGDTNARDKYAERGVVRPRRPLRRRMGSGGVRPRRSLRTAPALRAEGPRDLRRPEVHLTRLERFSRPSGSPTLSSPGCAWRHDAVSMGRLAFRLGS